MRCPLCGRPSDADWPLAMPDGSIQAGGCQECWEKQTAQEWWEMVACLSSLPTTIPAAVPMPEKA